MSKKVIKLSESQVKKVINSLIKEQETPTGVPNKPSTPAKVVKPKINNQEKFINYGDGSSKARFELLKRSGLDLSNDYNEFVQMSNAKDPKLANSIFNTVVNGFVVNFLKFAAQMGFFKEDVVTFSRNNYILTSMDKMFGTKYTSTIPVIFGAESGRSDLTTLYNSLGNLVTLQRQATGNPTKKGTN
jgi:hypothetical protein